MLSLIDFGPFLALFFVAVSLSGSVSLLFCCKSKKKSATKSQIQKQALVDSRKSKDNIPLKEGSAPGEKPPAAAAKGRQQKHLKTPPPQPAKGAAIGGGGAAGIRTAALFTPPPKAPAVADPTKTAATKQPATPPKPAAPKPSDKSKKDVRAGVAVPDDDTVPDTKRMEVSDSWRQSKLIKCPRK
ncbi:unnamed protein product [Meloidogyne enterolobii]|uniref:Uncharacterized protein n=1 Tax=Meloidogyne enterolobii TaxID=390850 RepID=A0ACB1A9Q1_MELEN